MAFRRRALWVIGIPLVLVLGTLALRGAFFPERFDVVSIKASSVYQDPALLERAWRLPAAAALRRGFTYQPNGSLCGPTSLADVEHSLGRPDASPKTVLAGSGLCTTGMCFGGLTLDAVAELERKRGRKVEVLRDLTLVQFRDHLRRSNDPARRYTLNFHRGPLFGEGHGHHSPIGGYLADLDLVFVLDVNEHFKPWLAPSARLYRAMDTIDNASGKKRGMLLIE